MSLDTGAIYSRTLNFNSSATSPNFFSRNILHDPQLLGQWTLAFNNGTDSAQVVVQTLPGAQFLPFVNSVTLSGTSANPTFTWTPPPGVTVNGYRINIIDKSLISPTNGGNVVSLPLAPTTTSYTVQASDFTVPGYAFALNKNYSIEISAIQTRDGNSINLGNSNLQSISRIYADFTPTASGAQVVHLPVIRQDGAYQFNFAVQAGQTYFIDPDVAIGYDYEIGAGDPNFQSVLLPVGIGDGLYDILGFDSSNNLVLLAGGWAGGSVFDFSSGGVNRFRVSGIEASAMLNPGDATAFITGLTFTGSGQFTGTQTPIVQTIRSVPEPASIALFGLSLAALATVRRRKQAGKGF